MNAGLSCPNRDGLIDTRGCIFCSAGGSGDFAADPMLDISSQLNSAVSQVASKYTGNSFIAYYQALSISPDISPLENTESVLYNFLNNTSNMQSRL